MSSSFRSRESYQSTYEPAFYNAAILTTSTGTLAAIAAKTDHTVYVQSILFACATGAAQTLTFQDSAGTPVVIARTKATGVQGEAYLFDFGPSGFPLTEDTGLNVVISGAGLAGGLHIEGYWKRTAVNAA